MQSKQNELNNSVKEARLSAAEAQQAQKNAQAAIESDEMNYEAVKKEIQKLIAAAAASKPQLSFSGFICPLKSYTRISSEYGWRKNPVSGVNKLHAGIDFAAPAGTPIYAAASGYVQVAGWSSGGYGNYVIIYHGKMTYALGGNVGGQVCQPGRPHRLCGLHRQLYRQPPPSRGVEGRLQGQCGQSPRLYSDKIIQL